MKQSFLSRLQKYSRPGSGNATVGSVSISLRYKNFVNGRFFTEGLRMTAGVLFPALIMGAYSYVGIGLICSLGAICMSIVDSPGPIKHRINGMKICLFLIPFVSILVSLAHPFPTLLAILLVVSGFFFSMFTVYGARASALGISALLTIVLSLNETPVGDSVWWRALYLLAGGLWYALLSISLYRIRPYRIIQQVLGDLLVEMSEFLKIRSNFYDAAVSNDSIYEALRTQQVKIEQQDVLCGELLFKTRLIIKETTQKGRILMKIYLDAGELFESVMTRFHQYEKLQDAFKDSNILTGIQDQIILLSDELYNLGVAIKGGDAIMPRALVSVQQEALQKKFDALRETVMNEKNLSEFVVLGRIIKNLRNIFHRTEALIYASSYDTKITEVEPEAKAAIHTTHSDIRPGLFFDNLNFNSNIFRHALRVSIALLVGFFLARLIAVGHSYWVLLTIVVILKPSYSLTKRRNKDRIFGTVLGLATGAILLYISQEKYYILICIVPLMIICYTFIRVNYFASVWCMTAYIILFFYLLYPQSIGVLFTDRLTDTVLGSAIAFCCSLFLVPVWEQQYIKNGLISLIGAQREFFTMLSERFVQGKPVSIETLKIKRRALYTHLANFSDAFNRMLSEPRRVQASVQQLHRLVVLSHESAAHFSTLAYFYNRLDNFYHIDELGDVSEKIITHLDNAIGILENNASKVVVTSEADFDVVDDHLGEILERRKVELSRRQMETGTKTELIRYKSLSDQYHFIYNNAVEIEKAARRFQVLQPK